MSSPQHPVVRIRPEVLQTVAYRQGRQAAADAYKLSSNENPFPTHPAVLEAIAHSSPNRYPDAAGLELRTRLATRFGRPVEGVHIGAGSVSILAQLIQAVAGPGDEIIYAWRSFEAYPGLVTVAGATSVTVPNRPDHGHDLVAMAAAVTTRTRAIIVCSPNNPTGTIVSHDELLVFLSSVPETVLVMLDEAYIEFVGEDAVARGPELLADHPNLVVLRTFSKAYGLAGLRIGYALGAPYILDAARTTAIPLSVTEQAMRGALAALDHEEELLGQVAELCRRRDDVWRQLVDQGWPVPRPHGNFVWLPTPGVTERAADIFIEHGIVARALGDDGIRVTIGEAESVQKLLSASAEVVRTLPTGASRPR